MSANDIMITIGNMRRALAVVLCILIALSVAGCSQPRNVETLVASNEYPVTVNEMTIDQRPQRVAVLSGSLADVILAMGYETSLVIGSEDCTQPELQVLKKAAANDTAAILAADPDIVLTDDIDEATAASFTEAGVQVIELSSAVNREDFERLYGQVGTVLNGSTTGYNAGIKAAQKIFSSLDDLARLVPDSSTVVTACYISDLSGKAVTGDQLGSVMMSYMGLTNVFKGRTGGEFDVQDLLLSDPTMIFCTEAVKDELLSASEYAELSAVINRRVYFIDDSYMVWQGRTVYEAAIEMMGLAYPELTESSEASVTMEIPTPTPEPTPEPSTEPTPMPSFDPIPSGEQGENVYYMQQRLSELGYLTEEYDGYYGNVTAEAVRAFQTANQLDSTGEADAVTLATLYSENAIKADGSVIGTPGTTPAPGADGTGSVEPHTTE